MSATAPVMHLAPACSEHDLVTAVRLGDDRAFEELYNRYRARIGAYVLGMVGDHGRAEDVTQEVFLSALRRMRESDRPIAFRAWIYEIAKNACIDDFRRRRRLREVSLDADDDGAREEPSFVSSSPTPYAAAESRQQLDSLRGAFKGLSETHHRLIVMRELEGLSYAEIGDRLGMTRPVVESTLFRARRRLSEEYEEIASGRRCEAIQAAVSADAAAKLGSLGVRERRRVARHLSHCQQCRREARLAGVDEGLLQTPGIVGKIAALLPFPIWRWRRLFGSGGDEDMAGNAGSHSMALARSAQVFNRVADAAGMSPGMGRAAAAAATVAIAAAGGGLATTIASHSSKHNGTREAAVRSGSAGKSGNPGTHAKNEAAAKAAVLAAANVALRGAAAEHAGSRSTKASSPGRESNAKYPVTITNTTDGKTTSGVLATHAGGDKGTAGGVAGTLGGLGQTLQSVPSGLSGVGGVLPTLPAPPSLQSVDSTVSSAGSTVSGIAGSAVGDIESGLSGTVAALPKPGQGNGAGQRVVKGVLGTVGSLTGGSQGG